jgi:hypothetical protein
MTQSPATLWRNRGRERNVASCIGDSLQDDVMAEKASTPTEPQAAPSIDIHYLKCSGYREASCDGAVGGLTPQNKLWVGFYTERLPIPKVVKHQLKFSGKDDLVIDESVPPIPVEARSGLIRNLEFGLYLTSETASELHQWLGRQLDLIHGRKK